MEFLLMVLMLLIIGFMSYFCIGVMLTFQHSPIIGCVGIVFPIIYMMVGIFYLFTSKNLLEVCFEKK